VAREGQLEATPRQRREREELPELLLLAPAVPLAVQAHVPPWLAPVADGRVEARVVARAEPEVGDDRLARRVERESLGDRKAAAGAPVVLAEGEVGDVRLEEFERVLLALVEFDLELHGVGLEVDEPAGLAVLG